MRATRLGISVITAAAATMLSGATFAQQTGSTSGDTASAGQQSQQTQQPQQQSSQQEQQQQQQQAPKGWVLVREQTVILTANEPQNHFVRAQEMLQQNNFKQAAAEARVAPAHLDMQASRKGTQGDQQLTDAANQLRQCAKQIQQSGQNGQVQQERQKLDQAFAQASKALAAHFQNLAQQDIQNQKPVMAGYDLHNSATALKSAYTWSQSQPSEEARTAMRDARRISDQLLTPTGGEFMSEAQPAGATMSPQQENQQTGQSQNPSEQQQQSTQSGSRQAPQIPQDANKVVQELGTAIQQANIGTGSQQQQQGQQENQPANPQQEQSGQTGGGK